MADANAFRAMLGRLRSGDTVRVDVARASGVYHATVIDAPFQRPLVHIEAIPGASERQARIRAEWSSGMP